MKSFLSHVSGTLKGALIGQMILVLALPVISRLYLPEDYGAFTSILSIAIILAMFFSLQMELGIVLPKDDDEAQKIAKTAVQLNVYFSLATFVLFAVFNMLARHNGWLPHLQDWILLAPAIAFLMVLIQIGGHLVSRLRHYNALGNSSAMMQLVNCGGAIILGLMHSAMAMLIVARLMGQTAGLVPFRQGWAWLNGHYRSSGWLPLRDVWDVIKRYPKFPLFTMPQMLLMTLSRETVVIILVFFHHPQAAGFYALVRGTLMMPASLVSTSIGQIFYREAAQDIGEENFRNFAYRLLIVMACIVTPGCMFIAIWGPGLFNFIFGDAWHEAGYYAMAYAPLALLFILGNSLGRIFELHNRQDILFKLQLVFETLSIGLLLYNLIQGAPALHAIVLYLVMQCVYQLTYLAFAFRLMHFKALRYIALMGLILLSGFLTYALHFLMEFVIPDYEVRFVVCGLAVALALGALILWFWRKFHLEHVLELAKEDAVN